MPGKRIARSTAQRLENLSRAALYAPLLGAPLAFGASRGWPLPVSELLVLLALLFWALSMLVEKRLQWRGSALDGPLLLLIALVLVQLALGNRPLAAWALAPPDTPDSLPVLPSLFLTLGTVAPSHTARSLLLLLTYAGAYVLVVHLFRTRAQLDRLVSPLLILGGGLAFFGLLDYLAREPWLLRWRDTPATGRLSGTFANPDHFAAWLTMLIVLGFGRLLAQRRSDGGEAAPGRSLRSVERRERVVRQYLLFLALVVMTVALVFTLSRAAMLSLLVTVAILLLLLRALGRVRWSIAVIGALLVATLGYGVWIGLNPLLARVWHADYAGRWLQWLSTLPMLRSFPVLGVGLGAYGDAYLRYQPSALTPGKVSYAYAHNDLLQIVVELGLIGAALVLFMAWRVGKDLVEAHLLGRATCPVGGGEDEGARRSDPFSVGLAVGALGSVLALLVHSLFDFSARIPANGLLAATCLGIATVALHTRFQAAGERLLARTRSVSLESHRGATAALGVGVVVLSLALALWIVRPALVAGRVAEAERPAADRAAALRWADAALALDSRDGRALAARGRLRLRAALEIWSSGTTLDGRVLPSLEERREAALPLVEGAAEDFQTAIRDVPSDPSFQDGLARANWILAPLDPRNAPVHLEAALAAFSRAAILAPHDASAHRALVVFAAAQGGRFTDVGLRAVRDAVREDPSLLPELVDRFLPLGLTGAQWAAMVPESPIDRAALGALLEERRLPSEAAHAYRKALEVVPTGQAPLIYWMLARLELRQERPREALGDVEVALAQDPDNPELHLVRAQALAALGDVRGLAAYRLAALKADMAARPPAAQPFGALPARAQVLVPWALEGPPGPARYHRALARYLAERRLWYQALLEWEAVLAETPQDAEAHFGRGAALDAIGRGALALEAYRQAVTLDEARTAYRLRLAQRLWETEQYYQAMNQWGAVLTREPGSIEARLGLAGAHLKAGDRAAAVQEYTRILRMVPDQPEARRELARLGRGG